MADLTGKEFQIHTVGTEIHVQPNPETGWHTIDYAFDVDVKAPKEVTELTAQRVVDAVAWGSENDVMNVIEQTHAAALETLPWGIHYKADSGLHGKADIIPAGGDFHSRHKVRGKTEIKFSEPVSDDHAKLIAREAIAGSVWDRVGLDVAKLVSGNPDIEVNSRKTRADIRDERFSS